MHVSQLRHKLLDLVATVLVDDLSLPFDRKTVEPDVPMFAAGLGLDSVDAVDLIAAIERRTGVRLPDDITGRLALRTPGTLVEFLVSAGVV